MTQTNNDRAVSSHYEHGSLLAAIEAGLAKLGKSPENVTVADLAPVDEFHIGGRVATEALTRELGIDDANHVLDIGCGLGGPARFVASAFGARVTGVDLADEYVQTGQTLCGWIGLGDRVTLQQGSALDLAFDDASFDGAYMLHVGMNIADKRRLFAEIHRVLRPGACFGIYDIMRDKPGALTFPVPWSAGDETNHLATAEEYRAGLERAGFEVTHEHNRRTFALEFFAALKAKSAANGGPPPLGLHTLMQASTAEKIPNMIGSISAGLIAPVELIARKR